jgi:thermitase
MLAVLGLLNASFTCRESAHQKSERYAPAEVLIKFKVGVAADSIQSLTTRLGLEKVQDIEPLGVRVYRITSRRSVEEVVRACQNNPHVEYAEPNFKYRIPEKN